jgi:hypothetical protein
VTRGGDADSLNRRAFQATLHCLTGCAIGEVLGLAIGTVFGWDDLSSIALAVVLAFVFGYGLTIGPLLAAGWTSGRPPSLRWPATPYRSA